MSEVATVFHVRDLEATLPTPRSAVLAAHEPEPAPPERKPSPALTRFQQLVATAVDVFNTGSLHQAALLLELADRWQDEQELDPSDVAVVRSRLANALDPERLGRCAAMHDDRPELRSLLRFFPAFAPAPLLGALRLEPRRDRRHWLLLLLETHASSARTVAASRLREPLGRRPEPAEWYFRRNLLHLLRRIPRTTDAAHAGDVDLAVRHARLGLPSFVVREAVDLLGQVRDERAESALVRLLQQLEETVPGREIFFETRDLQAVGVRVATALAGSSSPRARRAILNYAERIHRKSGRPMTALAGLGRHDLSADGATVDRLIGLIRRRRPSGFSRRLLALRTDQNHEDMVPLIEALSGTPLPVVRSTFARIVRHFPSKCSGAAAGRALAAFARRERTPVR